MLSFIKHSECRKNIFPHTHSAIFCVFPTGYKSHREKETQPIISSGKLGMGDWISKDFVAEIKARKDNV